MEVCSEPQGLVSHLSGPIGGRQRNFIQTLLSRVCFFRNIKITRSIALSDMIILGVLIMGIYRLFSTEVSGPAVLASPLFLQNAVVGTLLLIMPLRTAAAIYKVWKLRKDSKWKKRGRWGGGAMQDTLQLPGRLCSDLLIAASILTVFTASEQEARLNRR